MTRELVGLDSALASVDFNSNCTTHSMLRNKLQILDTVEDNNLPPKENSNDTHIAETVSTWNLHSPHKDSSVLVTLSDASQNSTKMQCYFHHLQNHFIDYVDDPVLDGAVIYAGDVPFQYNEQEGMYTKFLGNPTSNIFLATSREH